MSCKKWSVWKLKQTGLALSSCSELTLIKIFSQNRQNLKRKYALSWETKNMLPQAIVRLSCQKAPSCLEILTGEYDDNKILAVAQN